MKRLDSHDVANYEVMLDEIYLVPGNVTSKIVDTCVWVYRKKKKVSSERYEKLATSLFNVIKYGAIDQIQDTYVHEFVSGLILLDACWY